MARGRGHLCQHCVGRQAAWEGTWGWHTSPRRLMFDLKPCVFPLGIFILCTWQWAAGCLPLWARNVAGQGRGVGGEQLTWDGFGKGPAAGRLGALEPRATWTHYFSHHCDQILDKKAMYGRKALFCLWLRVQSPSWRGGAESVMAGRGKSQGCRSVSLGLLESRKTKQGEEEEDAACFLCPFFIRSKGPSPQDGATHFKEGSPSVKPP